MNNLWTSGIDLRRIGKFPEPIRLSWWINWDPHGRRIVTEGSLQKSEAPEVLVLLKKYEQEASL